MIEKISNLWNNYGWEIMVGTSLIIIVIIFVFFRRSKTNSKSFFNTTLPLFRNNLKSKSYVKDDIKSDCNKESAGEIICRKTFEKIFNKPFKKCRPDFLKNPITGINLELDMYNNDLRLACEYNGCQHYKFVKFFHNNMDNFRNMQYRDYLKKKMCVDSKINLIEVPYTVQNDRIEKYIIEKVLRLGYKINI